MRTITYFTKEQLRTANIEAIASGRGHTLPTERVDGLDDNGLFPIRYSFQPSEDTREVRCILFLSEDGHDCAMLDVSQEVLTSLYDAYNAA